MLKLLLVASLCLTGLISLSASQSIDALCKQVFTDCQACIVYDKECRRPGRPNTSHRPPPSGPPPRPEHPHPAHPSPPHPQRPTQSPSWPPPQNTPSSPTWPPPPQNSPAPSWPPQNPNYPESPETSPAPVPTQPPHNCVQYGRWCKTDQECCTKNCRLELVSMGPEHPDQHFTQSVCR